MSNPSYASNLIVASQAFTTYSVYVNFGLGLIGNLLNILIFTNLKIFHRNHCAFYLIAESIVDIGQLTHIFINEIWKIKIDGVDPVTVSLAWCKLKTVLPQWFRLMLAFIICFATIDQYLCTNYVPYLRRLSSLKIAKFQIFFASIFSILHTIPFGIFLEIIPSSGCNINNNALINYYSFFYFPVLNGLLPITLSAVLSILAYHNVRRIVRRQIPIERRRLDQQLTAMIFVRVIFFILLQLPFTTYRIYSLKSNIVRSNTIEYAINAWIQVVTTALNYFSQAVSFYIFFATSMRFRRQVKHFILKKCCQLFKCQIRPFQNTIQPSDQASLESGTELT